jgi:aryl-alcohol dehydrogenase-like predicted oxidoreductase
MTWFRREFLAASAAALGQFALGRRAWAQNPAPIRHFDPFETVTLGKTGIRTSRLGLGTGMRGGNRESNQTRLGREGCEALIRGGFDRGIRLFDMADLYGSHPYVIPALKDIPRDQYTLVSKIWVRRGGIPEAERPDADVVVERFLRELGTEYLDVCQIHCMTDEDWTTSMAPQMEILERLKTQGKIRAHGVSIHSLPALRTAAEHPWVDVLHTRINPYGIAMDGPPEEVAPVIEQYHNAGKGVIGMKLVGEGQLRNDPDKRREALRYVLGLGTVDTMIIGFESLAELNDTATTIARLEQPAGLHQPLAIG